MKVQDACNMPTRSSEATSPVLRSSRLDWSNTWSDSRLLGLAERMVCIGRVFLASGKVEQLPDAGRSSVTSCGPECSMHLAPWTGYPTGAGPDQA